MTQEKKIQFGGWNKNNFKHVRRKVRRFWEKDFNIKFVK